MQPCEICEILPQISGSMIIHETPNWKVNLADKDQTFLGRTYITLKTHKYELDQLSLEEEAEFTGLRNALIRSIRDCFDPITFNISCLKNDAFKAAPDTTPPQAAHVHWHVIPRYGSNSINFAGTQFNDPLPGRYSTSLFERQVPTEKQAVAIADAIRAKFVL